MSAYLHLLNNHSKFTETGFINKRNVSDGLFQSKTPVLAWMGLLLFICCIIFYGDFDDRFVYVFSFGKV